MQTVKLYIQTYQEKGLDYYLENHYLGYSGKLTPEQKAVLKEELSTNLYATSQAIADFIFSKFDDFKKAIFDFSENTKDFEAELKASTSCNFHIPETKPFNIYSIASSQPQNFKHYEKNYSNLACFLCNTTKLFCPRKTKRKEKS
ncbi:MAG: hypothetical protein OHK0045_06540 [Raineya sp.]